VWNEIVTPKIMLLGSGTKTRRHLGQTLREQLPGRTIRELAVSLLVALSASSSALLKSFFKILFVDLKEGFANGFIIN
jgi:hypothetical protein